MSEEKTERLQVLPYLKTAIEKEARQLRVAHDDERPVSAICWIARNVLELYVWTKYCITSEANAKTFAEDSARDLVDMLDFPQTVLHPGVERIRVARAAIIAWAKKGGFGDIDEEYTKVSAAAKSCGLADEWKMGNRMFSKFAHPTALLVMAPVPIDRIVPTIKISAFKGALALSDKALEMISAFMS